MRKLRLALIALAVLACGGDSTAPTNASVAGTWSLRSINGSALPFVVFQDATSKEELTSDVFTFTSSGTFTEHTTIRETLSSQVTTTDQTDDGTYTLNGTAITVHFNSDGSNMTGSVSGNTITVTDSGSGLVGVYQKQ